MFRAKLIWIILLAWFCCLFFLFVTVSRAEKIMLQWDSVDGIDGYYIFETTGEWNPETHQLDYQFDYSAPVTSDLYPDGKIPANTYQLIIDLPGVENADTRYMFTARSFLGDEQSVDSNVVSHVVSLVPPPSAIELAGGYQKEAGIINLSWSQPDESLAYRTVSHWIVYYRVGDGQWTAIGRIDQGAELKIQAPFAAVPDDSQADVEFTVVSYRGSGAYSANSEILTVDVDRRKVPPVQNLRINIEIPVI